MTYDAVLDLLIVVAIPAVVLVVYRLFAMSRRNSVSSDGNPLMYEIDPHSGEIVFGDEKQQGEKVDVLANRPTSENAKQDPEVSMVDVLAPDVDPLSRLPDENSQKKSLEEAET